MIQNVKKIHRNTGYSTTPTTKWNGKSDGTVFQVLFPCVGLHGWIGSASKFTMPFTLLEYVVRVANNIRSKFSEFSIDYNTNLPRNVPQK